MVAIITNSRVGNTMSRLEAAARAGCPVAQDQLRQQAMVFADAMMQDEKLGADMQDRKEMLSHGN